MYRYVCCSCIDQAVIPKRARSVINSIFPSWLPFLATGDIKRSIGLGTGSFSVLFPTFRHTTKTSIILILRTEIMPSLDLDLVAPSTHHVDSREKRDVSTFAGHAVVSATSFLTLVDVTEIHVRLLQVLTSTTDSKNTRISSPLFCNRTDKPPRRNSRIERTLREVSLPVVSKEGVANSQGGVVSKSYFYLDIPTNIPATTKTPIGTITYEIEATAPTSKHGMITHRRPLNINRQMGLIDPEQTQHRLNFPNSNAIQGMTLSQNSTPRSGLRISFTATIHTHWETAPAARPAELRHLVVRELRWHAEEVVEIISIGSPGVKYPICERRLVRKLCDGSTKGYWGSARNKYITEPYGPNIEAKAGEKWGIRIPFDFTIPKRAMIVDDVDLAAYETGTEGFGQALYCGFPGEEYLSSPERMTKGITVHHQVKIEFVMGEDVFHTGTGKLVERKRARIIVCPAIPFSVCGVSKCT
ncbi:unnamed protein product [Penicillium nalgiovense]|uniref:Uncharacterized protein n=1 Tax=Penicillium nalgiovense TaxID=60175 RepID=A0A9W4H9I5_PENNA|nr:unnamed protein product [Penicillium nalgiovense]CAG7939569.1 unnamed protein product [Penicillium nalgiovense]CAG7941620.1 unnamed protein product [Penicillium nalgiovense]CAG7942796.1 unnamed protein product [Penicillium nalgiovense]CAG7957764.1 unnamed protein product [Penicillium nalgiovense]